MQLTNARGRRTPEPLVSGANPLHRTTRFGIAIAMMTVVHVSRGAEHAFVPFPVAYAQATASQNEPPTNRPPAEPPTPTKSESIWNQPMNGRSLSLGLDHRYPLTGDYDSYYGGRLFMEIWVNPRHAIGISYGVGTLNLESDSVPDRGAHSPLLLDLGVYYRLHFTPPHVLLRPYGTVQLNLGAMIWDYREDLVSDGEEYWRDSIGLADAYVGAGLLVNISKDIHLFGEMGYGGMAFLGTTYHGFKNELFDDFGYVAIKTGVGLNF